jgi:hypothetical protein
MLLGAAGTEGLQPLPKSRLPPLFVSRPLEWCKRASLRNVNFWNAFFIDSGLSQVQDFIRGCQKYIFQVKAAATNSPEN